jgi:hypothetical protein
VKANIPFAEWKPDQAPLGSPGTEAKNVIPWDGGYKSFPALAEYSNAIAERAQGAYVARDSAGTVYNYAGTSSKLYKLSTGLTYTDVSTSGGYSTASDEWWEMAQWGNTLIATNFANDPQVQTLGGSNFTALGGTPPKARHIGIVRDFVVLGNVSDGTPYPNRVQWSGINNSASWAVSAATQADYQDLQGDGGWVQKVVGGEYGLIFQERSVWRMTYVGSPVVFQFDQIERARGAYAAQSVIAWGNMCFFLADDGFYAIVGGAPAVPIGDGKVDKYFLSDLRTDYAYRINATIDPVNKLVIWAYPGSGSMAGTPNKLIIYNWAKSKWSRAEVNTECLSQYAAISYTLEDLDAISSSLDDLSASLDSRVYTQGSRSLGAFNTSHKLATFSGTALDATVDTGEVNLNEGGRANVTMVEPLVDGATASVAVGERNLLSASVSYGSAVAQDAFGGCPVLSNAKFQRFRVTTSGAFNFAQGVRVDWTASQDR